MTTDIVKIYCGPSRRWRHVGVALSADLQTSELLASPSPPTHSQGPLPILAPTDWAGQGLQDYDLGSHRKKSSVSPLHVPSHCQRARERETGKFIADISGPFAINKEEAEWDLWSFQPLLSTFFVALTAGLRPGSPGETQDIRPSAKDAPFWGATFSSSSSKIS